MWYAIQAVNEEFLETLKTGKLLCEAWWQTKGRENIASRTFQTGLWFANMKNRFHWKDQPLIDQSQHTHYTSVTNLVRDINATPVQDNAERKPSQADI